LRRNLLIHLGFFDDEYTAQLENKVFAKQKLPHVEQELLSLPEHLRSPQFLVGFMLLDL
jgi:hypothetical protein